MPKILINNKEFELPLKIEYEGKEYWVKKATKTNGLFMNSQQPERKQNDKIHRS